MKVCAEHGRANCIKCVLAGDAFMEKKPVRLRPVTAEDIAREYVKTLPLEEQLQVANAWEESKRKNMQTKDIEQHLRDRTNAAKAAVREAQKELKAAVATVAEKRKALTQAIIDQNSVPKLVVKGARKPAKPRPTAADVANAMQAHADEHAKALEFPAFEDSMAGELADKEAKR